MAAAGSAPWSLLVSANTRHWPAVPWAALPALVYLWFYWRYARGWGWPASTRQSRRTDSRANPVAGDAWGAAILAGILGLASVVLFQRVLNRLVILPRQQVPDISQFPSITVACWLLTSAVVAGIVEETSFRGYMQKPIEQRHGPVIAILITGIAFGFAHFGHPEVTMILMPYYIAVAAVYGALAYWSNSVFPGMVLHTVGNVLGSADLLLRGRSEWQTSSSVHSLIWETGADASFWFSMIAFLVVGAVTVGAYAGLRKTARQSELR
jgi:membrane protease YdiL (CAAX protease family)